MGKSKLIELVVLGLWLLIAIVLFIRTKSTNVYIPVVPQEEKAITSKIYFIKKISVLDSNTFDIYIKDDSVSRILGQLPSTTVSEAKRKLIDLFNRCEKPRVLLKEKTKDGKWIVDFIIGLDNKDVNVMNWMVENNLIYQ